MAHKSIDRSGDTHLRSLEDGGDGSSRWDVITLVPSNHVYTIHGNGAYDARFDQDPTRFDTALYDAGNSNTWHHRVEKDIDGGDLRFAAGRGTGTAAGGDIALQTASASAASVNTKNALRAAVKLDTNYATANATPMLLWDARTESVVRVLVGPPDSGGTGYRSLRFVN